MVGVQRVVEEVLFDVFETKTLIEANQRVTEWIAAQSVDGWQTDSVDYFDYRNVQNPNRPQTVEVKVAAHRSRVVEVGP